MNAWPKVLTTLVAVSLLTGCAGKVQKVDQDIPSGGTALEAWAVEAGKDNDIRMDYDVSSVARTVCEKLAKTDDLRKIHLEVAGFKKISYGEAQDLLAIAIYGYCPKFRHIWESDEYYEEHEVKGVTPSEKKKTTT